MRKDDSGPFIAFMQAEAIRYARDISAEEIKVWFSEFSRVPTLEDFKALWARWGEGKYAHLFPKIIDIQQIARRKREVDSASDRTCTEAVGGERCCFPASVTLSTQGGGRGRCAAHALLAPGPDHEARSLQIIEQSRGWVPPADAMDLMERGAKMRAEQGERWRASHPELYRRAEAKRHVEDKLRVDVMPSPHVPPPWMDEVPPPDSEFSEPAGP